MNVSLTPELEKFIEESVASGRFASASEVVRHALRRAEEHEQWVKYVRDKVDEGLADAAAGRVISSEQLRAELEARRKTRSRKSA